MTSIFVDKVLDCDVDSIGRRNGLCYAKEVAYFEIYL